MCNQLATCSLQPGPTQTFDLVNIEIGPLQYEESLTVSHGSVFILRTCRSSFAGWMICQVGVCGHRGLLGEQSQGVLSCVLIASLMHVMVQVWAVGQGQHSTTQFARPWPSPSCPVAMARFHLAIGQCMQRTVTLTYCFYTLLCALCFV